jgi:hypothetical protein
MKTFSLPRSVFEFSPSLTFQQCFILTKLYNVSNYMNHVTHSSRCQWPRGLMHRSALSEILGSNPTGGMDVCCKCCQVEVSVTS